MFISFFCSFSFEPRSDGVLRERSAILPEDRAPYQATPHICSNKAFRFERRHHNALTNQLPSIPGQSESFVNRWIFGIHGFLIRLPRYDSQ